MGATGSLGKVLQTGASVKEGTQIGAMGARVYLTYIRAMGWGWFCGCWLLFALSYSCLIAGDLVLLKWVTAEQQVANGTRNATNQGVYISIYGGLSGAYSVFCLVGTTLFCIATYRASLSIHHQTISRILYAPYSWFQANPIGRIVSRFTYVSSLYFLPALGFVMCTLH